MSVKSVTQREIRSAVVTLNLGNTPLCVHSSLSSFGWVDGGPMSVVDGLLAEGCTVMVPSFTSEFEAAPPSDRRHPRNGCSYESDFPTEGANADIFTTNSLAIDHDLGAIARAVVADSRRARGDHPLNSFAAVGPLAVLSSGISDHSMSMRRCERSRIKEGGSC